MLSVHTFHYSYQHLLPFISVCLCKISFFAAFTYLSSYKSTPWTSCVFPPCLHFAHSAVTCLSSPAFIAVIILLKLIIQQRNLAMLLIVLFLIFNGKHVEYGESMRWRSLSYGAVIYILRRRIIPCSGWRYISPVGWWVMHTHKFGDEPLVESRSGGIFSRATS